MTKPELTYSLVSTPKQLSQAYALETVSFPPDEAASLSSLEYRQSHAQPYFLGAFPSSSSGDDNTLVAFTCATLTTSSTLTHDSMSHHDPQGTYVAIHSVCVDPKYRRQGIALNLLKEYLDRLKRYDGIKGVRLISHDTLVPLYQKAGFTLIGLSSVVHGSEPWYELAIDFPFSTSSCPSTTTTTTDTTLTRALPAYTDTDDPKTLRSPGKPLGHFLSSPSTSEGLPSSLVNASTTPSTNSRDLYCPRAECRCLIANAGTAQVVVSTQGVLYDLPELPRKLTDPVPPPSSSTSSSPPNQPKTYFSLPSPLAFENVGFSRPSSSLGGSTVQFLTCADCDTGPIGWHDTQGVDLGLEVERENEGFMAAAAGAEKGQREGEKVRTGRKFWVDTERVRYKV